MNSLSNRVNVAPFHAMDVLAEATRRKAAGHNVISCAVGQPAHPAPRAARDAAAKALEAGRIGYTDALGLASLKIAIAAHYKRRHGVDVNPDRIAVTTGSSAGFNLAFLGLFDPGQTVAIARPGYPAYRNILAALGLRVVEVAADAQNGFTLTPENLEAAARNAGGRIDGVLLASPANPTGTVTGRKALKTLINYCDANGMHLISDEIYHGLTFAGEETSALELSDKAIIINSFSKYYCMTGWRIGWMVLPEAFVRPFECLAQSLYISAPELSQIAAEAALTATEELEIYKRTYADNRALLMKRFADMNLPLGSPMDGAFYAYVDVSSLTNDSMAFAKAMLAEINVAATPGGDFDQIDGQRNMRFSYAGSAADMAEAMDRIETWISK